MFLFVSAESTNTDELQAKFACNGELSFFYKSRVKKIKLVSKNQANISSNYTINPKLNPVLAIRCRNFRSKPWIMGSVSNRLVTDTRWKCFSLQAKMPPADRVWLKPGFDDSHWAQAVQPTFRTEKGVHGEWSWVLVMRLFGYQPLVVARGCSAGAGCLQCLLYRQSQRVCLTIVTALLY